MNAFSNESVIVRVAGDQRFVVRKRHSWNNFEQIVTVAYLKRVSGKNPPRKKVHHEGLGVGLALG